METTIIITVASIYGGIFLTILLCVIYALYNAKKIQEMNRKRTNDILGILKNSEKISKPTNNQTINKTTIITKNPKQ